MLGSSYYIRSDRCMIALINRNLQILCKNSVHTGKFLHVFSFSVTDRRQISVVTDDCGQVGSFSIKASIFLQLPEIVAVYDAFFKKTFYLWYLSLIIWKNSSIYVRTASCKKSIGGFEDIWAGIHVISSSIYT